MLSLLGAIVMALILTYLAAIVVEWAVIARVLDTPAVGIAVSSVLGTLAVILVRGWLASRGGPFIMPPDALMYGLAGCIIGLGRMILRWRSDLAVAAADDPASETFS